MLRHIDGSRPGQATIWPLFLLRWYSCTSRQRSLTGVRLILFRAANLALQGRV
jgi:hypothetical protein